VLVEWNKSKKRWTPIPLPSDPAMRAAREAAREVAIYIWSQPGRQSWPDAALSPVKNVAPIVPAVTKANGSELEQKPLRAAVPHLRLFPDLAGSTGLPGPPDRVDVQAMNPRFEGLILLASARHSVDPNLVRAVIEAESSFNPRAVSKKGALGLMQLMPATARNLKLDHPFDPAENVEAGVRHLKSLLDRYDGDVQLSVAAYNAGPGAVTRSKGVPNNRQTRYYVKRVTRLYASGGQPKTRLKQSSSPAPKVPTLRKSPRPSAGISAAAVRIERAPNGVLMISDE
jgi:soluble lytic murein transglycosylase-like protein